MIYVKVAGLALPLTSGLQVGEAPHTWPSHMEISGSLLSPAPLSGPAVAFTSVSSQEAGRQELVSAVAVSLKRLCLLG